MRKYVYDNATVYITEPTEAQLENIRKSTERFVKQLVKEGLINHEQRRNYNRAGRAGNNARKRDQAAKKKSRSD